MQESVTRLSEIGYISFITAIRIRKHSGRCCTKCLPNPKGRLPRDWRQTQSLNSFYQTDIIISISFPRDVSITYISHDFCRELQRLLIKTANVSYFYRKYQQYVPAVRNNKYLSLREKIEPELRASESHDWSVSQFVLAPP